MYKKSAQTPKIILGIDPGTTRIGYGVISKKGGSLGLVECGLIEPGRERFRFRNLEKKLSFLIKKHKPDLAAVEKLYFSKNKKTAMAVAELRGAILLILNRHAFQTLEFDPNNVKLAVAGSGKSDKKTLAKYACMALGIEKVNGPDDISDALAIAIRASFERGPAC